MNRFNFEGPCYDYADLFVEEPPHKRFFKKHWLQCLIAAAVVAVILGEWFLQKPILFPGAPWTG